MNLKTIQKVIEIGKSDNFDDIDLLYFLPDFPVIHGSEPIFLHLLSLEKKLSTKYIEFLIKGLHKIELAYGLASEKFYVTKEIYHHQFNESPKIDYNKYINSKYRFGSPTQTNFVLYILWRRDKRKALEMEFWIASNGGNYYIERCENNIRFEQWLSERRAQENAIVTKRNNDEKNRILKKELRKQEVERINAKHKLKVEQDRDQRKSLMQMPIIELLKKIIIEDTKPIHYYEEVLLSRIEEIRDTEGIEGLLNNIKDKFSIKYPKEICKIFNQIENK